MRYKLPAIIPPQLGRPPRANSVEDLADIGVIEDFYEVDEFVIREVTEWTMEIESKVSESFGYAALRKPTPNLRHYWYSVRNRYPNLSRRCL